MQRNVGRIVIVSYRFSASRRIQSINQSVDRGSAASCSV